MKITKFGLLLFEIFLSSEAVPDGLQNVPGIVCLVGGCAVLLHGVLRLVAFIALAHKEAGVTDVQVEALPAVVPEPNYGINTADPALDIMGCCLCTSKPVQHGEPDKGLRLLLQPYMILHSVLYWSLQIVQFLRDTWAP